MIAKQKDQGLHLINKFFYIFKLFIGSIHKRSYYYQFHRRSKKTICFRTVA